jgi:hypothetical protein
MAKTQIFIGNPLVANAVAAGEIDNTKFVDESVMSKGAELRKEKVCFSAEAAPFIEEVRKRLENGAVYVIVGDNPKKLGSKIAMNQSGEEIEDDETYPKGTLVRVSTTQPGQARLWLKPGTNGSEPMVGLHIATATTVECFAAASRVLDKTGSKVNTDYSAITIPILKLYAAKANATSTIATLKVISDALVAAGMEPTPTNIALYQAMNPSVGATTVSANAIAGN